jgi:hypothetical protein
MHNHDAESEACLSRQIINNSVKRKAMDDFCERPHILVHKELQSQFVDTLTYQDIRNISRNIHKACSSQLLPLPTDIEETHETLSAVQVQTSSKEQISLLNDPGNNTVMFSRKMNSQFSSSLMCFTLTGHSNQHRSFFTNY